MKQYLLQENLFLWHLKSLCQKTVSGRKTKFYLQRTYIYALVSYKNEMQILYDILLLLIEVYHTGSFEIVGRRKFLFSSASNSKYFSSLPKAKEVCFSSIRMSLGIRWVVHTVGDFQSALNLIKIFENPTSHLKLFKVSFIEIIQDSQQI